MSPELRLEIQRASMGKVNTSIAQLAHGFIQYTITDCAPGTLPARRCRIAKFVEFLTSAGITDIGELNNAVLAIYFATLENSKASTQNATRKTIKSFINWIEQYKEIATPVRVNAIGTVREGRRKPRYMLAADIEKIINCREVAYIDRLLIVCAFRMGLRVSELSNMRLSDIKGDEIRVIGKGDHERIVTVPAVVLSMIRVYEQLAPYDTSGDAYLFQTFWRGEWCKMTPKTIWRRLKIVFMRVLGVEASPHWMRHSYAVDLLLQGCDIVTIKESLGHTDLKTTQKYLTLANEMVKANIHKYLG